MAPAAPWVIATANASHDRRFLNRVLGVSGPGVAPRDYEGLGISAALLVPMSATGWCTVVSPICPPVTISASS